MSRGNRYRLRQRQDPASFSPVFALGVVTAPVVGAALYFGLACASEPRHVTRPSAVSVAQVEGGHWQQLEASTMNGTGFSMAQLTGKPVILYFWATWCPQCKVQREVLGTLSREWQDHAQVVGLTLDNNLTSVNRYLETQNSLSRELKASPELLDHFGVHGLPTLVAIDATGVVRNVSSGLSDAAELRLIVGPLLQ